MSRKAILSIEDDEGNQFLIKMMAEKHAPNVEIISAYDGAQALDILENTEKKIDLVLLDIIMPGLSGLDFLKQFSQLFQKRALNVIVLSSSDNEKDKQAVFSYDFVADYIVKPISPESWKKIAQFIS